MIGNYASLERMEKQSREIDILQKARAIDDETASALGHIAAVDFLLSEAEGHAVAGRKKDAQRNLGYVERLMNYARRISANPSRKAMQRLGMTYSTFREFVKRYDQVFPSLAQKVGGTA